MAILKFQSQFENTIQRTFILKKTKKM